MNKDQVQDIAQSNAIFIATAETLPELSALGKEMADPIEKTFRSFEGVDLLTVAAVLYTIGAVDTNACMIAYASGVPASEVKDTAVNALSYLYVADSIFRSEGVMDTLEDYFSKGTNEGS